ncbi:type IV pilus biogenesis protein PilM [Sulfuricystis multivorans]|uniref:type IV pilus biogenesis protein PilM n=1 Tax=Sulfuricystis multivorans TaxID=2211108 RepID=UPI000F846400|nr:agglutinin biogenesis protein MshI [Sulfuricystis multivorans]
MTVAEVARDGGKPVVRACEGYAREGGIGESLKRLRRARRFGRQRCVTLLAEGQYQLLQVELPTNAASMTRDELREALRWRVKEMVDFPVERAGIDLLEIPPVGNRPPQVWVVLASHDVLQPIIWEFQEAKVTLAAIDIPELAQRNLAALFEEANRGLALLSFDRQGGRLVITYQGELYMTRHIDVGSAELADPRDGALYERVLLDIQRSLDSFDRNYGAINVARLLIGPMPQTEAGAFIEYLGGNLSLPVASAHLAEVMDFTQTPHLDDPAAQADAWLALGAALRE